MTPEQSEELNRWLYGISREAPFQVKTTEAMHYRRTVIEAQQAQGRTLEEIAASPAARGWGIRDGNGIVFVSHDGNVYPSGFLPLTLGNVRETSIVELYRDHPVMLDIRDPQALKGRCGACDLARICGGSRARAFAWTGDPLESDPLCAYVPVGA